MTGPSGTTEVGVGIGVGSGSGPGYAGGVPTGVVVTRMLTGGVVGGVVVGVVVVGVVVSGPVVGVVVVGVVVVGVVTVGVVDHALVVVSAGVDHAVVVKVGLDGVPVVRVVATGVGTDVTVGVDPGGVVRTAVTADGIVRTVGNSVSPVAAVTAVSTGLNHAMVIPRTLNGMPATSATSGSTRLLLGLGVASIARSAVWWMPLLAEVSCTRLKVWSRSHSGAGMNRGAPPSSAVGLTRRRCSCVQVWHDSMCRTTRLRVRTVKWPSQP